MPVGRPRKVRDGPKKPLCAYTLFVVEVRSTVQRENPNLSFKEVAKLVGKRWRELPDKHRRRFEQLAEQDKARYEREKEEYKQRKAQPALVDPRQRRKKRKDAPKNPLSAYAYYVMDVRKRVQAENPKLSFREVAIKVGEMWRSLGQEDRASYSLRAEQDKARYDAEMLDFNGRLQEEALAAESEAHNAKKVKLGPKNPLSSYTYFVMEVRPQISVEEPALSFGEVAIKVGSMWRSLSSEERFKYNNLAAADKLRYEEEKEELRARMQQYQQHVDPPPQQVYAQHSAAADQLGGFSQQDSDAQDEHQHAHNWS